MEENVIQNEQKALKVSGVGEYMMKGIAKWMNIIAIIATIMMLLLVVAAIYLIQIGYGPTTGAGIVYLIVAAIYIYPIIKTFAVSKNFNLAVDTNDDSALESGFENLKGLVTFLGVLMIIGFILLIISIIVSITAYNNASDELNRLLY